MEIKVDTKKLAFKDWILIGLVLISLGLFIKVMWFSNKNPYSKEDYQKLELKLNEEVAIREASQKRELIYKDSANYFKKENELSKTRIWNLERGIIKIKNKYEKEIGIAGSEHAYDVIKRFTGYTDSDSIVSDTTRNQ